MTPILIIFILGGGLLICTLVAIRWDKIIRISRERVLIKILSMGPPHNYHCDETLGDAGIFVIHEEWKEF